MQPERLDTIFKANKISKAERLVLHEIVKGLRSVDIADRLCLSYKTVKFHNTNIYRKFSVKSNSELISKINRMYYGVEPLKELKITQGELDEVRKDMFDMKKKVDMLVHVINLPKGNQ